MAAELSIAYHDLIFGQLLGKGSFGEVYAGRWHGLPVAIKRMTVAEWFKAHSAMEALMQEAQVLAKCRHPNVLSLYGVSLSVWMQVSRLGPSRCG